MFSGDSLERVCINGLIPESKNNRERDQEGLMEYYKTSYTLRLHRQPLLTLYYATREALCLIGTFLSYLISHKRTIVLLLLVTMSLVILNFMEGVHQEIIKEAFIKVQWWIWWIFLGFLSSCGFGSGLHTFVLYLGPFIARVTMAAYECGSINFPSPPYPNQFICPEIVETREIGSLLIIHKVLLESMLWGFGTALGELPPYFMARAAALNGFSEQDIPLLEDTSTWHVRAQKVMKTLVKKVGFLGIMLCASIPNPLFDLAGMTCGHFLVPFSTFFGATVLGKAVNKMLIQLIFVVFIFSKDKFLWIQSCVKQIPKYGSSFNALIEQFLQQQKEKIHRSIVSDGQSWIQLFFSFVQLVIILCFLISIIHSLADNYSQRLQKQQTSFNEYIEHSKLKNH